MDYFDLPHDIAKADDGVNDDDDEDNEPVVDNVNADGDVMFFEKSASYFDSEVVPAQVITISH